MAKLSRKPAAVAQNENYFAVKPRKAVPFEFVLEALDAVSPVTRSMFGCVAVYVGDKIMFMLRDKTGETMGDNGVWIVTHSEHHESLRREFPSMRPIQLLEGKIKDWQLLPADDRDFEGTALRACELVVAGDPRMGKVPQRKASRAKKAAKARKSKTPERAAKQTATQAPAKKRVRP